MLRAIEKWPDEPALVSKDDEVYTFMDYYKNAVKWALGVAHDG